MTSYSCFNYWFLIHSVLYKAVIEPLSLPPNLREIVGAFLGLGLASGYAMSIQVRCITWLLVPTFFGKKGRSFVAAYAIIFLIAGEMTYFDLHHCENLYFLSFFFVIFFLPFNVSTYIVPMHYVPFNTGAFS